MSTAAKTFFLVFILCLSSIAGAQTHRGSVRGTITDPNGAVIPGAAVKAVNIQTNESRGTVSGD